MRLTGSQNNYSRFTLRLHDSTLHSLFWDFTIEEIYFTMPYFTILAAVFSVSTIFSHKLKVQILVMFLEFALYVTVHFIGQRRKRWHVYGMLFLFGVRMITICSQQFLVA